MLTMLAYADITKTVAGKNDKLSKAIKPLVNKALSTLLDVRCSAHTRCLHLSAHLFSTSTLHPALAPPFYLSGC